MELLESPASEEEVSEDSLKNEEGIGHLEAGISQAPHVPARCNISFFSETFQIFLPFLGLQWMKRNTSETGVWAVSAQDPAAPRAHCRPRARTEVKSAPTALCLCCAPRPRL